MNQRRVFISGMGAVSCLGSSVEDYFSGLLEGRCGLRSFPEWEKLTGQRCSIGGPAENYVLPELNRQIRRSMSKMSEMGLSAVHQAIQQADLPLDGSKNRMLLALGSTIGSPQVFQDFFHKYFEKGGPEGQPSTAFLKTMNHALAANVAMALPFNGPVIAPGSACTTSSQNIILGWELIQSGLYDVVIAGGADELHPNSAAVFDIVYAASTHYNDRPQKASRPFDKDRDGLVVSEGAGVVILESEDHLRSRKGRAIAEILGGAYLCDGQHMTHAQSATMAQVMEVALDRAKTKASEIQYVNAHATSTLVGDSEEAAATQSVFGSQVPVSSQKGHLGHSLAACGALEVIATTMMMKSGRLIPTLNLEAVDPACAEIQHVKPGWEQSTRKAISNNFAFGGLNTSLIISIESL